MAKKKLNSQQRLLKLLWEKEGVAETARKLNVQSQIILNWINRGHVPLSKCGTVAKTLNVTPLCLNFEGVLDLMSENGVRWDKTVAELKFAKHLEEWILKGIWPKGS